MAPANCNIYSDKWNSFFFISHFPKWATAFLCVAVCLCVCVVLPLFNHRMVSWVHARCAWQDNRTKPSQPPQEEKRSGSWMNEYIHLTVFFLCVFCYWFGWHLLESRASFLIQYNNIRWIRSSPVRRVYLLDKLWEKFNDFRAVNRELSFEDNASRRHSWQ